MSSSDRQPRPSRHDAHPSERIDDRVVEYVDRLNDGEELDPFEVLAAHPEHGAEILRRVEAYAELERDDNQPLGTLGDYTLRRQIGRGGMGVVYEAWENSMDRAVALKVLPGAVAADERALQRFVREAKTAGQLNHPNVVGVHAMGVKEQTPYYAMELVEGETLAQILAKIKDAEPETETPLGAKDEIGYFAALAKAFADVADGLQHAHSRGVTHRDIKPSNLILDVAGRLRILDFGLARLEGQESLTLSRDIVGTPIYMSPEQARRKKIPVDHRTDVYSLGATMYEAICGRPPFRGKDHADTLSQIIERDPVEPRRVNTRVPKDLETIVLKCLRKDSGDRYGTAEALGQDLRRFVRGNPVEATTEGKWERVARHIRRRRTELIIIGTIFGLLLAVAWLAWLRQREEDRRRLAEYEPAVLDALTELLRGRFSLQTEAGTVGFLRLRLQPIRAEDFQALAADDAANGDSDGTLEHAIERLEFAAREVPGRIDAHYHLGRAYSLAGRMEDAREAFDRVLERDPSFLPARVRRSQVGLDNDSTEVHGLLDGADHQGMWSQYWLAAFEARQTSRWDDAASALGKLITDYGRHGDAYVGASVDAYLDRGLARLRTNAWAGAQRDFSAARSLTRGLEPALLLARAYHESSAPEEASQVFQELLDATDRSRHPWMALWIIGVYVAVGDHTRAIEWTESLGDTLERERLRAYLYLRLGDARNAERWARTALARSSDDSRSLLILAAALGGRALLESDASAELVDDLLRAARRAAELSPDDPAVRDLLETAEQLKRTRRGSRPSSDSLGGAFGRVRRLGPEINSVEFETTPVVSADGLELFFSSSRPGRIGHMDIWLVRRETRDAAFGSAANLRRINSVSGEWPNFVSTDGERLYFQSMRAGNMDIFYAKRIGPGGFGDVQALASVNTDGHEGGASLSDDELTIYFVARREGGRGGRDLWVATRTSLQAPFGEARNLAEINTEHEESFPSISGNGLTIFWSDLGRGRPGGRGAHDLWCATRKSTSERFGPAINLRAPLNTPFFENEARVTPDWPARGSKIYFKRGDATEVFSDIYEATWEPADR